MSLKDQLRYYNSDKVSYHSYGPIYEKYIGPLQQTATDILELGVLEGASVRAWRDYFPNAQVIGIDNETYRLVNEDRIKSIHANTVMRDDFISLSKTLPQFDIIIDDASHVFVEQLFALTVLYPNLKKGGYYFIEDIYQKSYFDLFAIFPGAELFDLRAEKGQRDDLLVMIRK